MSYGAPDYFSVIDIRAQTLARVLNRPTYGGALFEDVQTTANPSVLKELINIEGTGMIYGFSLISVCAVQHTDSYIKTEIDGNLEAAPTWQELYDARVFTPCGLCPYLTLYQPGSDLALMMPYGITFDENLIIYYYNNYVAYAEQIHCFLSYTLT